MALSVHSTRAAALRPHLRLQRGRCACACSALVCKRCWRQRVHTLQHLDALAPRVHHVTSPPSPSPPYVYSYYSPENPFPFRVLSPSCSFSSPHPPDCSFVLRALSLPCNVVIIAPPPSPHARIERESQLFLNALTKAGLSS
jgi:hypothetical protein